jgi:GGDEF domain-containing protein
MNLRQMNGTGKTQSAAKGEPEVPGAERFLTLLIDGAAMNMPEIDAAKYKEFRENVGRLGLKVPDRLPDADKLALIREIVREFEQYRNSADNTLRERVSGWRALAARLLVELLNRMGIDSTTAGAVLLVRGGANLLTGEEIQAFVTQLEDFLRVSSVDSKAVKASQLKAADRSVANDNAAGLRGGGAAVEHVSKIMKQGGQGFVVFFRLGFLEVIGERFGMEAVQDSVMAVSAFLTSSLRSDDAIYHWSDSSLLAVVHSQANEQTLTAAMRRIVDNNRDITIQIGERNIMLRIPMEFEVTPIQNLRAADDLFKLSQARASKW